MGKPRSQRKLNSDGHMEVPTSLSFVCVRVRQKPGERGSGRFGGVSPRLLASCWLPSAPGKRSRRRPRFYVK